MKRKALLISLAVALVAMMALGVTLAYFTDKDQATNTFVAGNVKIALHEDNKEGKVDEEYQEWLAEQVLIPGNNKTNTIAKNVTVENTGKNDAYVWIKQYIPAALDVPTDASQNSLHVNFYGRLDTYWASNSNYWEDGQTSAYTTGLWDHTHAFTDGNDSGYLGQETVDGVLYNVYVFFYADKLASGATTTSCIHQVYMDKDVKAGTEPNSYKLKDGTDNYTGPWKLIIKAYAIQADGFADVYAAYAAYDGEA